jgi:RHS repeat-associated protein
MEQGRRATPENRRVSISPPVVELPKGGGAIRGIGETLSTNPVTGTSSIAVPIVTSPGRGGFGPALSLSYDSGAGNGPFGFGWTLDLPAITRKTDKGLPRYVDTDESDVFLIAGAEDLVPQLDDHGEIVEQVRDGYRVRRYRPRIEGLFARIERWSRPGDTHWRSVSHDNITTIYGRTDDSRLADPADPARIFSWLICERRDGKGNAIVYSYAREDAAGVDPSLPHERNRTARPAAGRYVQRIRYGNREPWTASSDPASSEWLFEVVFDHGEAYVEPVSASELRASATAGATWAVRPDPFSSHRAGFEVRTYRRCHRILMFHRFPELGADPYLVRSTELDYDDLDYRQTPSVETELAHPGSTRAGSFLRRVTQRGHLHDPSQPPVVRGSARYRTYTTRSLPPLELGYSRAAIQDGVRELDPDSLANLPYGIDGAHYRWVDLDGEGASGVLTEQGGAWFYKPNRADIAATGAVPRLGPIERLPTVPTATLDRHQLLDISGNGRLDVAALGGPIPGYFERTGERSWASFRPFASVPSVDFNDPNLRLVDLTGDGLADALVSEGDAVTWYPSLAERGFGAAVRVPQPLDDERGPRLVFADATQSIHLADMSGDGLADLVRIRNGEVCYWPNLGYGRFGAKVTMDRSPWFAAPERFDHHRLRLTDVDGSGTTDVIYVGADRVSVYVNQAGNGFTAARTLSSVPRFDDATSVITADVLGNGTACLVWSSPLPADQARAVRYIDLVGGVKPHLLISLANQLGAETRISYAPSTKFYLADLRAGAPWITRLPFPVHCVERVTITDRWRGTSLSTSYSYHHGYFDGPERELRGFGRVEQVDVESFGALAAGATGPYVTGDGALHQPPVKTITWYDTGAFLDRERIVAQLDREYFRPDVAVGFREHRLPEPEPAGLISSDEWREALRARKGRMLRQEVYELDGTALAATGEHRHVRLFTTAFHSCSVRRLQPRGPNRNAVFLATEDEAITYHYDLDLGPGSPPPDPRIAHTLNLDVDDFGNVRQSIAVGYPRRGTHADPTLPPGTEAAIARVQHERHVAYTERRFTNAVDDATGHRTPAACEVMTFELTGIAPAREYFARDELGALALSDRYPPSAAPAIPVATREYHELPGRGPERRIVEHTRTLYLDSSDAGGTPGTAGSPGAVVAAPLGFGRIDARGLRYEDYQLALTAPLLDAVFGAKLDAGVRAELANAARSGYLSGADLVARFGAAGSGQYWLRSGIAELDAARFFVPTAFVDAFGGRTVVTYLHDLLVASTTDAVGNTSAVTAFDLRVLSPARIEDANGNASEVAYDALGLATAMAVAGGGDSVAGIEIAPPLGRIAGWFTGTYDETEAAALLQHATARHLYHLGERVEPDGSLSWGHHPASASTILREHHVAALATGGRLQTAFEYSDGGGAVLVNKAKAEPAPGTTALRWIASGKTVLNNKGNPVKQYEPYFSSNEHRFEELAQVGVTPLLYYDAVGRLIRTEAPDGSYSRVELSPWHVIRHDANDTIGEPGNAWYAAHAAGTAPPEHQRAAAAALVHAGTPAQTFLDSLGRDVIAIAHERHQRPGEPAPSAGENHVTFTRLDAEGKPLWIRDPRGNLVMQYIQPPMPDDTAIDASAGFAPCHDIVGHLLFQHSMDGGDRWTLDDAAGRPMFGWDANERAGQREERFTDARHDAIHRPTDVWLVTSGGAAELIERRTYGEGAADDRARNLRGKLHVHRDPSGQSTFVRYDFAGRPLEVERRLAEDYKSPRIDWQTASPGPEAFTQNTAYDALGRIQRLYGWHRAGGRVAVHEPSYNDRGLLDGAQLVVRATKTAAGHDEGPGSRRTTVIAEITYDAKGQREAVRHGNGTRSRFTYDPQTFRIVQLRTTRPGSDPAFPSTVGQFRTVDVVQNLFYTHDPVGNVTEIYDDAFRPAFFANQIVEPDARYTYDSLYRLIAATGREQAGASAPGQVEPPPLATTFPVPQGDPADQRNYTERYRYDAAGNLVEVAHTATSGWTRHHEYAEHSNRLLRTWFGDNTLDATTYPHDTHGNLLAFANVDPADHLQWDHRDMIQVVERGGGGRVYYQYDAGKQRTRKVSESQQGAKAWERIYLGVMEIYRRYANGAVVEEIESHHVFEGQYRVLLVDDVIATDRSGARTGALDRYQYTNHLGSSCLELDDAANVISYEEYHPYGTTAFRMARSQTEAPKRYRFTGMERDDETGLGYHHARYYAPWLGRWSSADPAGVADGPNRYRAFRNHPVGFHDGGGQFPIAAELADMWEHFDAPRRPTGSGEMQAARVAAGTEHAAGWLVDQLPAGSGAIATTFRNVAVGAITALKVATDAVGGLGATIDDPSMAIRGIMRLGAAAGEGATDWQRGDKLVGGSKIAAESLTAITLVLGAVGAARAAAVPRNPNLAGGAGNALNRVYYTQFERVAAQSAEGPLSTTARQVTIQPIAPAPAGEIGPQGLPARVATVNGAKQVVTSGGKPLRFRVDAVDRSKLTGGLSWEEAKSTPTARLTDGQRLGFPLFEQNGGIVQAHNAGSVGLPFGTVLGPQGSITILRPINLLMRLARPAAGALAAPIVGPATRDSQPTPIPRDDANAPTFIIAPPR